MTRRRLLDGNGRPIEPDLEYESITAFSGDLTGEPASVPLIVRHGQLLRGDSPAVQYWPMHFKRRGDTTPIPRYLREPA
jgi:hypothetical protein